MTQATAKETLPKWLQITEDGFRITLKYPTELSGMLVDSMSMRAPCVRDIRAAQATCSGDEEKREMSLFASLTQTPEADLMALKLVDYMRLQGGYFRLVQDDGV